MDTTYDEARRCPRCNQLGNDESATVGPRGSRIHTIRCPNERCRWYNTTWIVQVNSDGKIQEPTTNRQKSFPKLPDKTDAVQAQMQRLYENTLVKGSEEYR